MALYSWPTEWVFVGKRVQCDEQGRFAQQTSDDDILRVIRESEFPAVTARWVADTVGMKRRPVHQRLEELHERGEVERGNLSRRVVIWWLPEKV